MTIVVLALVASETQAVAGAVVANAAEREAVLALGIAFRNIWLASMGGFYVALAVAALVVSWSHRKLARRIDGIAAFAAELGTGGDTPPPDAGSDDSLGALAKSLIGVGRDIAKRDAVRTTELDAREQLARIQRAMGWVDSEDDAKRLVGRALFSLVRATPAELLMADSSHAHLLSVVKSSTAPAPGCTVQAPGKCPAVQRGAALEFADSESLDACPKLLERDAPCGAVCVPVLVMGRSVGVLHLTRPRGEVFAPRTVEALETLTAAFGTRIGMLRALGTARLQAETDPMTGLLNRRSLEERATSVLGSCTKVVAVIGDLDHFKKLNDLHGHGAGDKALRGFAQVLKATLRPGDIVARYGGEEFVALLANATGTEAVGALDRVRAALEKHCATSGGPVVTVSFGAAEFPRHGEDLESLIKVADGALYQAKAQGRDRVVLAE